MKRWLLAVAAGMMVAGCAGGEGPRGRAAIDAFGAAGAAPAGTELPLVVEGDPQTSERLADMGIGLGFIAVLWLIGLLISRSIKGFRSYALPALGVAIIAVFFTRGSFFGFKSVTLDDKGVAVAIHGGEDQRIEYAEVTSVSVAPAPVFPVVTDARELVLEGGGRRVGIPFFVPDRDRIAALLRTKLPQ
ncbi:MAG: hypothetical protein FJ087_20295 [Deltaproteobacteria bacterium]|nr:hypothetical protein [Deltaproteobacteria bacterium]